MIYSGTTPKFKDDINRLPPVIRLRALGFWTEWQALAMISSKAASAAEIARREEMFAALAKRIDIQPIQKAKDIYRCNLSDGYRAIGKKFVDASGKQRIVFFAAGSHKEYDRMTRSPHSLVQLANENVLSEHQQAHAAWRKKRRVRIDRAMMKLLVKPWATPKKPAGQAARWVMQPN